MQPHFNHRSVPLSDPSCFYENPRYIMFICMVINDALQLSLVTALYVVSYIFRKIHASVCCFLVTAPTSRPWVLWNQTKQENNLISQTCHVS